MRKIRDYNEKVMDWNLKSGDVIEFIRLLEERNNLLRDQTSPVDFFDSDRFATKNYAGAITERGVDPEKMAFHLGLPHQLRLHSFRDENTGHPYNTGVFFSISPSYITDHGDLEDNPNLMVYFLDVCSVEGARIQTNYESPVISRHDLEPLARIEKEGLFEAHRKINDEWIRRNTVNFEFSRLEEYKERGLDWLIVPDPIKISY